MQIIGSGPHYNAIQRLIADLGISSNVKLYGFVNSEDEVYDILSKCMVGVATWNGSESDNSRFADPGKPKLYALLGLPIIITKFPIISKTINQFGAGIIIDFNSEEFINAIDVLFSDSIKYQSIMSNLISFQKICRARTIFDEAFFKTNTLLLEGVN
jgi:glycosyltransferase involved in cell wall biosynthesis